MVCVVVWLDDVCEVVQTRGKCGAWHSFKAAPSCPLPLIQVGTKWPPRWPALAQADTSGPKLAPHGHQVGPSWPKLPHTIPELAQVRTPKWHLLAQVAHHHPSHLGQPMFKQIPATFECLENL